MAYETTPRAVWYERTRAAFRAIVGGAADIWPNVWAVVAKVLATLARELDLRMAWLFRQIFVSTCDPSLVARHAFEYGLAASPAGRAAGAVTLTATAAGAAPAGLAFQRADGALLPLRHLGRRGPGPVTLQVQADAPGEDGNTGAGVTLTLISDSPLFAAAAPAVTGAGGLSGGTPAEDVETLREAVLERKRNPPQGGSAARLATLDPADRRPGRAVWVSAFSNTDRRVWIAFLTPEGTIPAAPTVAAVQAALNDAEIRPVTARVTVVAPTATPVAVTATGVEPLTAPVIAAVRAELEALFAERMEVATPTRAFVLPRAWISEAISRAVGEDRHTLTAPAADVTFSTAGQLPTLGTLTLS